MSNLFNQNIAPQRQLGHTEEVARERQQRLRDRADLKRALDDGDGPDRERRARPLALVAALVAVAVVAVVVLALTSIIHL